MEAFCKALSAVAMRAIKTDQFADQDLVQCLKLLAVRDPGEFAKFVALTASKQSYLAARPTPSSLSRAKLSIRASTGTPASQNGGLAST
jgi:hypothetical protein